MPLEIGWNGNSATKFSGFNPAYIAELEKDALKIIQEENHVAQKLIRFFAFQILYSRNKHKINHSKWRPHESEHGSRRSV